MPPRRSVPRLTRLTLNTLSDLIRRKLLSCTDTAGDWVRELVTCLDTNLELGVHNDLDLALWRRLGRDWEHPDIRDAVKDSIRTFLPALVGPQTRVIDFTSSKMIADNTKKGKAIMRSVYEIMDSKCPNLDTLVMGQSFIFVPELVKDINAKLTRLNKLVVLKLMYIAQDAMLTNIAALCPRIREMSLKGSSHITDQSAEEISSLKQLSVLDIQGTGITGLGCLAIIERVGSLEWLEHCPFNCDSDFRIFRTRKEMLDIIKRNYNNNLEEEEGGLLGVQQRLEEESPRGYSIKNFWLFNPKTEELQVAPFCPRMEKIRLDFVFQDMNFSLDTSPLTRFHNLHTLDLNFYDNHNNALFENILKTCGAQLKGLLFNVCASYRSIVECHNIIGLHCPRLTSLSFTGDHESPGVLDQECDSLLLRRHAEWQPHPRLESLTLGGYCTDGRLAWLLSGCPNIRVITLDGNLERLSDSGWLALLAENPLASLERLWLNTSTDTSLGCVTRLLEECPALTSLGRLIHLRDHAGGARRDKMLELVAKAKEENWDLDIVWVTPNSNKNTCA